MENNEIEFNPFALKAVTIGKEEIYGRPIQWDREMYYPDGRAEDGEFMIPILYEGTCPVCSQMIQFDNICSSIKCEICGNGEMKRDVAVDNPFTTLNVDDLINDEEFPTAPEIPLDIEKFERAPEEANKIEIKTKEKKKPRRQKKEDISTPLEYDDYEGGKKNDLDIEDLIK